jgi:hypothetical protein
MIIETDFIALNEHLQEVQPIFDTFCARHGFANLNERSSG